MNHSTLATLLLTTPFVQALLPLSTQLLPLVQQLGDLLIQFRTQPLTPQATHAFERTVHRLLRELGRTLLEWTFNHLEPDDPSHAPARLRVAGETYRRRDKHPNTIATLFGSVRLRRLLYEPLEAGVPCLHPLEQQLGVEAGCATPALAERAGQWLAQQPQRAVQAILRRDHGVHWSQETVRKVTASLRDGLAAQRQSAQCRRVLEWLHQAQRSRGGHRPVLVVGRDGIQVPLRHGSYREGAVATVSVFDRRGKRLGTVYLGHMPEEQQQTLSTQLTALIEEVLGSGNGPCPRLAYVTDGGWHPTDYYRRVLRPMQDPRRPGQRLHWERIIDFYHAAEYIGKLAEVLFGEGWPARAWARRMRKRLKEPRGVTRVLQSAAYHRNQVSLSAAQELAYEKAAQYLRKRRRFLDYSRYRREGLPLGSGVTEAGCKTVFTQRLKQSGMGWEIEGGQVVVDLRVLWLSGVWDLAYQAYLRVRTAELEHSTAGFGNQKSKKTA